MVGSVVVALLLYFSKERLLAIVPRVFLHTYLDARFFCRSDDPRLERTDDVTEDINV